MIEAADDYLYQVGDVVKVRDDLTASRYFMGRGNGKGLVAVSGMIKRAGTYVTIKEQTEVLGAHCYRIEEGDCWWVDDMFECKKEPALTNPDNSWEEFFLN